MVGIGYYHNFFSPLPQVSQRPNGAFLKLRTQAETYTKTKTKMAADTENEEISLKKRKKWKQPIKQHTKWNTGERNRERERERERETWRELRGVMMRLSGVRPCRSSWYFPANSSHFSQSSPLLLYHNLHKTCTKPTS